MNAIKNILKENNYILRKYSEINRVIVSLLVKISPVIASKYLYKLVTGDQLNLKNPRNFNEKIQWLKLYWQHPLVVRCADKFEVRSYVSEKGYGNILNGLYGVYNNTTEISWDNLPQKFALKTTNNCGTNIICTDKSKRNREEVFKQLDVWLKQDNSLSFAEIHYSKMTPRIICEKYIETESGIFPNDYKIFCFNGKPKFVYVGVEREKKFKKIFMDLDWNPLDILKEHQNPPMNLKKPQNFDEMVQIARKLSKPFPFVRVDLYDLNGKTIFGEMTFTPTGGLAMYYSDEALLELGDMIKLPSKYTDSNTLISS